MQLVIVVAASKHALRPAKPAVQDLSAVFSPVITAVSPLAIRQVALPLANLVARNVVAILVVAPNQLAVVKRHANRLAVLRALRCLRIVCLN